MGRMNAESFAGAVEGGEVSLKMALYYHLRSNHFPPLPHAYAPVAMAAIALANDGQWDDHVELGPEVIASGVIPRKAIGDSEELYLLVSDAVEIMHLDAFITWEDND